MADDVERSGEAVKPLKIDDGRSIFAGWPTLVFLAGMLVFAFHACTHMVAAGDTWVAMACGRHHSNHGVDTVEPFSANSHDAGPTKKSIQKWPKWARSIAGKFDLETVRKWHPTGWVNQNWLTHTTFYQLASKFGSGGEYNYDALVYWKFIIFTIEAFCIYFFARLIGVSVPMSALSSAMAMLIGRSFLDIRPACYANLLASGLLLVMALAIYKNYRYIWLIVPITVFWANVHGGYIYVFLMMIPFVGVFLLANLPKKYSLGIFCIGAWSFMYLRVYKFITHDIYNNIMAASRKPKPVSGIFSDSLFKFLVFLIVVCIVLLVIKNLKPAVIYAYTAGVSFILLLTLMFRMAVSLPSNLNPGFQKQAETFIRHSNISFFFFLAFLLFIGITVSFRKDNIITIKTKAIFHSIGAAIAAFIAMVLFNPYRLTNLTHTFEISVSKHAESWRSVNEWHPAFEMENPVGSSWPFLIMFIAALVVLGVWGAARFLKPKPKTTRRGKPIEPEANMEEWPKINVAIITVTVLSVYMAVASRRFIPIAAAAACPIIALMLEQSIRMILSRINYNDSGKLEMPALPPMFYRGVIISAAFATLVFGGFWGAKFKKIYLDPWPNDGVRDSVFMRMTASNVKPFDVCQFMRDNKLSGNMFNYWTEGGAIAFGQTPDPETGKTPLQLFMDGRAQAAYDHSNFMLWRGLYGGGPKANDARRERRHIKTGSEEMRKVGDFLNAEMKKSDIWVFVLPSNQFRADPNPLKVNYFPLAMSTHPDWILAYMDDHQRMYVNQKTKKGRDLLQKILKNEAKFPNNYSKYLTLAKLKLGMKGVRENLQGFELAKKAFNINQTQTSMMLVSFESSAKGNRGLSAMSAKFVEDFVKDFANNKDAKSKEGGYGKKLEAAIIGSRYLSQVYKTNSEKKNYYSKLDSDFATERGELAVAYKW